MNAWSRWRTALPSLSLSLAALVGGVDCGSSSPPRVSKQDPAEKPTKKPPRRKSQPQVGSSGDATTKAPVDPMVAAFKGVSGVGMEGVVPELSGLVASRRHPGVLWGLGDSGTPPHLYALRWQPQAGRWQLAGEFRVVGAPNIDWEDLAVDDQGRIYIADIGNNLQGRRDLVVHRVREPEKIGDGPVGGGAEPRALSLEASLAFDYPKRGKLKNYDAESLVWHAGRLYLATKHRSDTRTELYRFPAFPRNLAESPKQPVRLEKLGAFDVGGADRPLGGMTTAADLDWSGRWLALMTYHAVFIFDIESGFAQGFGKLAHRFDLRQEITVQNEAIAWLPNGQLLIANEEGGAFVVDKPLDRSRSLFPAVVPD